MHLGCKGHPMPPTPLSPQASRRLSLCLFPRPSPSPHQVECEASLLASLGGKDVERLPSASTCYNMLKLPNYR